jgi:hypothetical protein
MKRVYRVSVRETWLQHLLVEAESVAAAVAAVKKRGGAGASNIDRLAGPLIVPDGIEYLGAGGATARVVRQPDGRRLDKRRARV